MKKYLFILGLVGTALFTACSSADDLVKTEIPSPGITEEEKALIVEAGQDSDVPITLGSVVSSRAMTRTPIGFDDGTNLFVTPVNQYLGVFCFAHGKQTDAPDFIGDNVSWISSSYPYAKWLDNVPAQVVKYEHNPLSPIEGGADKDYSYIQFMKDINTISPTAKNYYYPFGNWYYYDFFAYYPYQEDDPDDDNDIICNAESCTVKIDIDGSQDIIWGQALGSAQADIDGVKAYSSKYLRLKKESVPGSKDYDVVPGLEFEHKLTQLCFSIKAHDATHAAQLQAKGFRLKGLSLKNVYNKLQLVVASKDANVKQGKLSIYDTSSATGVVNIQVKATDDTNPFPILIEDAAAVPVGYAIVPPSALISGRSHDNQYLVILELEQKDDAGNYPGDDVPDITIILPEPTTDVDGDGNPDGFAAGYKYNITLDVYNPTKIQATATLADWEEVAVPVIPVE